MTGIVKRLAVAVATVFMLAACSSRGEQSPSSPPGPATGVTGSTSPPPAGRIVFTLDSLDSMGTRLYTAAPDGSDRQVLTDFGVEDPDWSPDGSMIAFNSEYAGNSHVFTINADGTALRQVTRGRGFEGHPSWSPDGQYLVVDRQFVDDPAGLFVASVSDGSMTRITKNPYDEGVDAGPQYSHDGTRIVFIRSRPGQSTVWVVNADGRDPHRITPWKMRAGHPWWSPDGARIVFYESVHIPDDQHIFVINADGTGLQQLTDGDNDGDFHPSWSPDGQAILFTRYTFVPQSELFALYTMKPDGSRVSLLYKTPEGDLNDVSLAPPS